MFTKQITWIHKLLRVCKYSKLEYRLYTNIDTSLAAYVLCKSPNCSNRKVIRDYTKEELRNDTAIATYY